MDVVAGICALSVSVSVAAPVALKLSAPRAGAPGERNCLTGLAAGSGHSAYGTGLAFVQARLTAEPWAAVTALASVSVLPWTSVIRRETPPTVGGKPSGNFEGSATVTVVLFAAAAVRVDSRGGHAPVSERTIHECGWF